MSVFALSFVLITSCEIVNVSSCCVSVSMAVSLMKESSFSSINTFFKVWCVVLFDTTYFLKYFFTPSSSLILLCNSVYKAQNKEDLPEPLLP